MPDACCATTVRVSKAKAVCPTNQKVGKKIDAMTLKALLALPLTQVMNDEYRFCPDPTCTTVYYREDGGQIFTEADLREKVYQKHPHDDETLICYCFQITLGEIRAEIAQPGTRRVVEKIKAGIQAGQCACDIRNPQGDCCLGNVIHVLNHLQADS